MSAFLKELKWRKGSIFLSFAKSKMRMLQLLFPHTSFMYEKG
jgi:hypothetical protein